MGQTLQTVIDEENGTLSEKAVLQLALRLVSVLLNDFQICFYFPSHAIIYEKAVYSMCVYVFCSWMHWNSSTRRNMPMQTSMLEIFTSTLTVTQRSVSMSLMN